MFPGFDAEEVSLAGVSGWTIVTSRASGFPAKFGIRISAGFELFDGINAAYSFLSARFELLATSNRASQMLLCIAMISLCPIHDQLERKLPKLNQSMDL